MENLESKCCLNKDKTCLNCPAAKFKSISDLKNSSKKQEMVKIECNRRPDLGSFDPNITFEQCPQWQETEKGYLLKDMKVMVLGMDGYLGWTLALKLASLGCRVSGIDNYTRRKCSSKKDSHSVVPILDMPDRIKAAKEVMNYDIDFREIDIRDRDKMRSYLEGIKPEAIVHYAEIPSAPYSMVDADQAIETQDNNTIGTLGLLWLIKDIVPSASLIKLGTMGEYGVPKSGRPIFEGFFPEDATLKWGDREWSMGGEMTHRDAVSFYHLSKVQDTANVAGACKFWGLRSYDVMQGIIYGVHTEQVSADPKLRTRFDIDEWFGTVINRFVAQTILGMPMTIFGKGQQIKATIALDDAMECIVRLLVSPPEAGKYEVVNQLSGLHKLSDIAETVAKIGKEFQIDSKIQRIKNPRIESEDHPIEVVTKKLSAMGFETKIDLEEEVRRMFKLLTQPEVKDRIREKSSSIEARTTWNGEQKESEVLESYDAGVKQSTGHVGKLIK